MIRYWDERYNAWVPKEVYLDDDVNWDYNTTAQPPEVKT